VINLKVVPPERLGMNDGIYHKIMAELDRRGIKIFEKTSVR
jgi:hypothetical protein